MLDQTRIETLRHAAVAPALHVIDGARCAASDGGVIEVISPLNGEVMTTMAAGTAEDTARAIRAARAWSMSRDHSRPWPGVTP